MRLSKIGSVLSFVALATATPQTDVVAQQSLDFAYQVSMLYICFGHEGMTNFQVWLPIVRFWEGCPYRSSTEDELCQQFQDVVGSFSKRGYSTQY